MSDKFSTGVRFNHNLGILETTSFVGEGVGAALFIAAFIAKQPLLAILGVISVIVAVVALLAHLGRPDRAWRAMTRIATSGVSRGTAVISGFLGFSIASLGAGYLGFPAALQDALTVGALVFSVPVMVYAGMLLRSMRAIRLWRGPFVPLAFVAHSLATGATIAAGFSAGTEFASLFQSVAVVFLLIGAALSVAHLVSAERSVGVRASFERLLAGDLRARFLWGAGAVGVVLPLAGLALLPALTAGASSALLLGVIALMRLYGDFTYRNCIIKAGAYEPVMPTFPQRPLGPKLS